MTHTDKQNIYLRQVMISLNMLLHAHKELNELWRKDKENDVNLDEYLKFSYPYPFSFDCVAEIIKTWVSDARSRMFGENKCHIHTDNEYDELCPLCNLYLVENK